MAVTLFPVIWMLLTSIKTHADAFSMPPVWAFKPALESYVKIISGTDPKLRFFLNSAIITSSSVIASLAVGCIAAYSFARFKVRGSKHLMFFALSIRMMPPIVNVLPLYILFRELKLLDTRLALILVYMTFNIPFVIWMMKGFFEEIPIELEESAMIDGCSRLSAFSHITFPLSMPGIIATSLFCTFFSWNEFMFALILTRRSAATIPVAIAGFWGGIAIDWIGLSAMGTIATAPILLVAIVLQKYLVRGLTFGALKG